MSEADLQLARNATSQLQVVALQEEICWAKNQTDPPPGRDYCGRIFDGISCWEPAPAGSLVSKQCPGYFGGFYSHNTMSKLCTEDGSWLFSEEHNSFWTNYTSCGVRPPHLPSTAILSEHLGIVNYTDNHLLQMMTPVIKHISRVGYGVSLSALVVAMVIFCSIRKLRTCPRNSLHMHLFMSFILKASMWVAMDVVPQELLGSSDTGSWLCKAVTAVWQYFTLANYSWVTMEGLYLFCLIHLAMFSDHSRITAYVALGWGFPVCFVVPWVIVRALKEDFYCWRVNINKAYFWIIRAPTIVLILVNAVMFVFIILVLLQKLNASISAETRRYRKLARSTLVLMPLFGFHYVLLIGLSAFINVNHVVELIWLFWDQLFASFQGFSVALLYCFLNSEVKQELRKLWVNWRYNNFGIPNSSSGRRTARNDRQTARSSVQSTTLLDKTTELTNNSRTPSPNPQTRSAANRLQTHKEDAIQEEMQENRSGPAGDVSNDVRYSPMRPVDTVVTYSRAGGSECVQFAVTAPN